MENHFFSLIVVSLYILNSCDNLQSPKKVIDQENKYFELVHKHLSDGNTWHLFFIDSNTGDLKAEFSSADITKKEGVYYEISDSVVNKLMNSKIESGDRIVLYSFGKFIYNGEIFPTVRSTCCDCVILERGFNSTDPISLISNNRIYIGKSCEYLETLSNQK